MDAQQGPQLDVDELRTLYGAAIASYEDEAGRLQRERMEVSTADFGVGFASQGARIVNALDNLHDTSLSYLSTRSANWESILALVSDVVDHDEAASVHLNGVDF